MKILVEKSKKEKSFGPSHDKSIVWQSISIAMQLGYTIALPLVIFAITGRLLDKHYNSSPIFLLTGIVLSLIISSILAFIKIRRIISETEIESKILDQEPKKVNLKSINS